MMFSVGDLDVCYTNGRKQLSTAWASRWQVAASFNVPASEKLLKLFHDRFLRFTLLHRRPVHSALLR